MSDRASPSLGTHEEIASRTKLALRVTLHPPHQLKNLVHRAVRPAMLCIEMPFVGQDGHASLKCLMDEALIAACRNKTADPVVRHVAAQLDLAAARQLVL